jgi:hypothetical protein
MRHEHRSLVMLAARIRIATHKLTNVQPSVGRPTALREYVMYIYIILMH